MWRYQGLYFSLPPSQWYNATKFTSIPNPIHQRHTEKKDLQNSQICLTNQNKTEQKHVFDLSLLSAEGPIGETGSTGNNSQEGMPSEEVSTSVATTWLTRSRLHRLRLWLQKWLSIWCNHSQVATWLFNWSSYISTPGSEWFNLRTCHIVKLYITRLWVGTGVEGSALHHPYPAPMVLLPYSFRSCQPVQGPMERMAL